MTNKEAIKLIGGMKSDLSDFYDYDDLTALDMAISALSENKCFDGMTNREIISEFVERDDSFVIMVDEVNGTVNIELSLDFWNAPYQKGGE